MNEQWIKEQLKREIEAETPDILEQLLKECRQEEQNGMAGVDSQGRLLREGLNEDFVSAEKMQSERKAPKMVKRRYLYITIAVAAAILLIVSLVGNLIPIRNTSPQSETKVVAAPETVASETAETASAMAPETTAPAELPVVARVALDVNPSVEMEIDQDERVIKSIALNEDGKEILNHIDLSGADLTVASYAIIGAMLAEGYLTDNTNSILVSVTSDKKADGKKIQENLSAKLNTYLENSQIGAAIIGQFVDEDESVKQFAEENGISAGKAWIIKKMASEGGRMTEDSLLKLSTQDLLLLWTNRVLDKKPLPEEAQTEPSVDTDTSVAYGQVHASTYISGDDAIAKALEQTGISGTEAGLLTAEFDCEDGMIIYEVEFQFNGQNYEVDVNATTGEVLAVDIEQAADGNASLDDDDDDDDLDEADDDDRYEADDDDRYEADDDLYEADDDDRYEADDDLYEADDDDHDDGDDRYEDDERDEDDEDDDDDD